MSKHFVLTAKSIAKYAILVLVMLGIMFLLCIGKLSMESQTKHIGMAIVNKTHWIYNNTISMKSPIKHIRMAIANKKSPSINCESTYLEYNLNYGKQCKLFYIVSKYNVAYFYTFDYFMRALFVSNLWNSSLNPIHCNLNNLTVVTLNDKIQKRNKWSLVPKIFKTELDQTFPKNIYKHCRKKLIYDDINNENKQIMENAPKQIVKTFLNTLRSFVFEKLKIEKNNKKISTNKILIIDRKSYKRVIYQPQLVQNKLRNKYGKNNVDLVYFDRLDIVKQIKLINNGYSIFITPHGSTETNLILNKNIDSIIIIELCPPYLHCDGISICTSFFKQRTIYFKYLNANNNFYGLSE
eukprot:174577_1